MSEQRKKTCRWSADEDGTYFTRCGNAFQFFDGAPDDNKFKFCPYCGGVLTEKRKKEVK